MFYFQQYRVQYTGLLHQVLQLSARAARTLAKPLADMESEQVGQSERNCLHENLLFILAL